MRRGLISWSKDELPEAVLDRRVDSLRAAMAEAGLDAVLAYTTPARAAAVAWLAGFVPYWNQGLLVVPREGRPVLVSALSNRVNGWMRRNAHVADVLNAPRIGSEAGRAIAAAVGKGNVGVVDFPHLPAAVIEDVAAEGHQVSDATALFRAVRAFADAADIALHDKAAQIAAGALAAVDDNVRDAARLVATIDGEARRQGAEEVYPAVATGLASSQHLVRLEGSRALEDLWAVRVSVSYKGAWVRITRTRSRDAALRTRIAEAERALAAMIVQLPRTEPLAPCVSWLVEATRSSLPLEPIAGSMIAEPEAMPAGGIVSVLARLDVEGTPVLLGAPMLLTDPPRMLG